MENRRRILRWLANFVVLCQNDVICEFHSPKTMELILVVVISAGMAEHSQNGVSRSLSNQVKVKPKSKTNNEVLVDERSVEDHPLL